MVNDRKVKSSMICLTLKWTSRCADVALYWDMQQALLLQWQRKADIAGMCAWELDVFSLLSV